MTNLTLEQDQFIRSVEISKNDVFSLFLGAGASITSGIPSAGDCIWEWKKNLYASKHISNSQKLDIKTDQVKTQIQKWLDSEGSYPTANSNEEYSFYVEECYPIEDDRRKFFQRICEKNNLRLAINCFAYYMKQPSSNRYGLQILMTLASMLPGLQTCFRLISLLIL